VARGWESKSVEAQQDERATASTFRRALTPDEQQHEQARQRVMLELQGAVAALAAATHPARRQALEAAVHALRAQLASLQEPAGGKSTA
jgi:hypothetical protein